MFALALALIVAGSGEGEHALATNAPTHEHYDGAVGCGTGSAVGSIAGALVGVAAANETVSAAEQVAPQGFASPVPLLAVGAVAIAASTAAGAAAGAVLVGDQAHPEASAVAGAVGAVSGIAVFVPVLLVGTSLSQGTANPNDLASVAIVVGTVTVAGVLSLATVGVVSGVVAPLIAD